MPLAIFFELFWLDLFPIGSYLPPMAAFPYLLLLGLCGSLGWQDPGILALPLALSLPLAYIVPLYEGWLRKKDNAASDRLILAVERQSAPDRLPGLLVFKSCLQFTAIGLGAFSCLYGLCLAFIPLMRSSPMLFLHVDWPVLYAIAAVGALLSLRIRTIYLAFALCMAALVLAKAV